MTLRLLATTAWMLALDHFAQRRVVMVAVANDGHYALHVCAVTETRLGLGNQLLPMGIASACKGRTWRDALPLRSLLTDSGAQSAKRKGSWPDRSHLPAQYPAPHGLP